MIDSHTPLLRCPCCNTDLTDPVIGLLVHLSVYRGHETPKPPAFPFRPASADATKPPPSGPVTGGDGGGESSEP